jgi:hypothetical protein
LLPLASVFGLILSGQQPYRVPEHPPIGFFGGGDGPGIGLGGSTGLGVGKYPGPGLYPGQFVPRWSIFESIPLGQQPNIV